MKFQLGQKVIVNTAGNDTIAIIDYPTIRNDIHGKERSFKMKYSDSEDAYLCRFTEDISKCWIGGAKRITGSFFAQDNTLFRNAQFIPESFIKPAF